MAIVVGQVVVAAVSQVVAAVAAAVTVVVATVAGLSSWLTTSCQSCLSLTELYLLSDCCHAPLLWLQMS